MKVPCNADWNSLQVRLGTPEFQPLPPRRPVQTPAPRRRRRDSCKAISFGTTAQRAAPRLRRAAAQAMRCSGNDRPRSPPAVGSAASGGMSVIVVAQLAYRLLARHGQWYRPALAYGSAPAVRGQRRTKGAVAASATPASLPRLPASPPVRVVPAGNSGCVIPAGCSSRMRAALARCWLTNSRSRRRYGYRLPPQLPARCRDLRQLLRQYPGVAAPLPAVASLSQRDSVCCNCCIGSPACSGAHPCRRRRWLPRSVGCRSRRSYDGRVAAAGVSANAACCFQPVRFRMCGSIALRRACFCAASTTASSPPGAMSTEPGFSSSSRATDRLTGLFPATSAPSGPQ